MNYQGEELNQEDFIVVKKEHPCFEQILNILNEHEERKIVAFIGRAGSGKDYQCQLLQEHGYVHLAFADALRDIAFNCFGISETEHVFYDYLKSHDCIELRLPDDYTKFNFRTFLERLGTQGIRKWDNDFWCRCLINTLKENQYRKVCISDMRFINEYKYLKKYAEDNGYEFQVIFCDYHSDRYQENNNHESAKMGNFFATHGYHDLDKITEYDMIQYSNFIESGMDKYVTVGKLP